jgi:hypothetical protein
MPRGRQDIDDPEATGGTPKATDLTVRTGQSGEGFSFEVVVSSLTLVMLVTGFEA